MKNVYLKRDNNPKRQRTNDDGEGLIPEDQ